jgi:hypothetical protein
MTAYKLLVIILYSLRSCFAPTNIFAKVRCTPELMFNPCEESHKLRSNSWEEPDRIRDPKVVVEKLTGGKMDREQQCWEETSLEHLREKGVQTGLTAYICEIEERLIPIIGSAE